MLFELFLLNISTCPLLLMSKFSILVFSFGIQGGSTTGRCSSPGAGDLGLSPNHWCPTYLRTW